MVKDNKISVPFHEFHVRMQEIVLEGGFVHRIEVKSPNYILFITWEQNTAGDAPGDNKPEAPPVQHESTCTTEEQLP